MIPKVLITIAFIFFTQNVFCQPIINFDEELIILGDKIEIFEDTHSSLSIEEVIKSNEFKTSTDRVPNMQITSNAYWIRFNVVNKSLNKALTILLTYPLIDSISIYQLYHDSVFYINHSGGRLPFDTREIDFHQYYIYPIKYFTDDTVTCYLRIKSGAQLMLPIYLGTQYQVFEKSINKDIIFGIYIGIMLVMILYNTFVYVSVRDRHYLYYIGYLLIALFTQASLEGYLFRFLIPNHPYLATLNIYISSALIGIAAIEFAKRFLHSKKHAPLFHKISYFFLAVYGLTIILPFYGQFNLSYKLILASAGLSAIYVFFMALIILIKGSRFARYFLIAWSVFIVCVIIYVLKDFGIIPYNFITNSTLQFGSAFEAVLLSLALADKINIYRAEKEAYQQESFIIAKENERIVKEQNVILEQKVKERTTDLEAANDNLEKTLVELKEAETQLVESEKMSSLGQLTAGIAHEINNPINFVTSNISPLKRDVGIMQEMIDKFENILKNDLTDEEKKTAIDQIKKEEDYEYLKEEIEILLKGIDEGAGRTAEIVKGLRIFSRLDEDDIKYADINEGLDSTLIILNSMKGDKIEIKKEYGEIPLVECYPGKLNQVFLNVATNAIHAIKEKWNKKHGGILKVSTKIDEENVFITISDNGIGMSEETQRKIYEPFYTTKEVGVGTGLGMSIAWNTIQKHNGKIELKSTLGEGTDFTIIIPIKQALNNT